MNGQHKLLRGLLISSVCVPMTLLLPATVMADASYPTCVFRRS